MFAMPALRLPVHKYARLSICRGFHPDSVVLPCDHMPYMLGHPPVIIHMFTWRCPLPVSEVTRPALLLGPCRLRVCQGMVCELLLIGVDDLAAAVLAL